MSDIFISYSREDSFQAEALARLLEEKGFSVWWDRWLPAGQTFDAVIESELDKAKCVIVLWSKQSVESRWVGAEAEEGLRKDILVPVLLEDTRLPLRFRLLHYIDLSQWRGENKHTAIERLLNAVQELVQPSFSQPPAEVEIKGDVFISYAREDSEYVEELLEYLKSKKISAWADNNIDYGELWWRTIVANIRECRAMVVVMTPKSEASKWVEREILFADELEKPIFPLLLKGERFPLLIGMQYHDVRDRSMPPIAFSKALKNVTR